MDVIQENLDFNKDPLGRVNLWCWEMDGSGEVRLHYNLFPWKFSDSVS